MSPLDGIYRWTLTKRDALEHGTAEDRTREGLAFYPNTCTVELKEGTWTFREVSTSDTGSGTFSATGDRISFTWPREGLVLAFTFKAGPNGTLRLRPILPMDKGDQFVWSTSAWQKIG